MSSYSTTELYSYFKFAVNNFLDFHKKKKQEKKKKKKKKKKKTCYCRNGQF